MWDVWDVCQGRGGRTRKSLKSREVFSYSRQIFILTLNQLSQTNTNLKSSLNLKKKSQMELKQNMGMKIAYYCSCTGDQQQQGHLR